MTLEQELVIFHFRLGAAITQWAVVESHIRDVVVVCFDNVKLNREAITVGLFSLEGFRAKLAVADGIIARKLAHTTHRNDWAELVARADKLASSRNKLAHWQVGMYDQCRPGRRVVLVPWTGIKQKKKTRVPRPPNGSQRITDIIKIAAEFFALAMSLQNFQARICGRQEPHPKSDELAENAMTTVANIESQIRAIFAGPQQSSRAKRREQERENAEASLRAPLPGKDGNDSEAK